MKIKNLIKLRKDNIFGGAVQTEWFYNDKAGDIAKNYVFHGPNYFAITDEDVEFKNHKLMDTCTYAKLLSDRLYEDEGNSIILTIAGYGTGKSHLAVTLGKLFSEERNTSTVLNILQNINRADASIANSIEEKIGKPNLVLVLNGMNNFNLNYEILNSAKKVLKNYGYNEEIFSEFTKAYNIAANFLFRNFEKFPQEFNKAAINHNISTDNLKEHMYENIYSDDIFNAVNDVYRDVTGDYIRWDDGISAGEVLRKLVDRFCGDSGEFNKVLILFDEFGRYLEYAAEYPSRAGDASLQQIFEAIQDCNNQIIFNAFIQSDLKTYLARVNKSSNISRYIGRYEIGEKIYLSSNLETIFANLIESNNDKDFNHYVENYFENSEIKDDQAKLFNYMHKWLDGTNHKGIWKDWEKYYKIIVKGTYPFNPLSIWMLTSLSDWYQQRSALNFLIKAFENIQSQEILDLNMLPNIKPIDIIKGDLYEEILLAETQGRQKSEYCIQYDKILIKHTDKLDLGDRDILAAILIIKLLKFKPRSKDECKLALNYLTQYSFDDINRSLYELEENQGIIEYDERNCVYNFLEDAAGIIDFNRIIQKKRNEVKTDINLLLNNDILKKLNKEDNIVPEFSKKNFITSNEWQYEVSLLPITDIDNIRIKNLIKDFEASTTPDKAKGKLIYVYINGEISQEYINKIVDLYINNSLSEYPFIFLLLDDRDNRFYEALVDDLISRKFSDDEKMKFNRFIIKFNRDVQENLEEIFTSLVKEKLIITSRGVEQFNTTLKSFCNDIFENIYPDVISFDFSGFNNKIITPAKKIHSSICRNILGDMINYQWIQTQNKDVVNRIQSLLANNNSGWGVLEYSPVKTSIVMPKNLKVNKIFDDLDTIINTENIISLKEIRTQYVKPPYGINDYALTLLLSLYIYNRSLDVRIQENGVIVNSMDWASRVFIEKALNFEVINNSFIKKIDLQGYEQKYDSICSKVEKNTDVTLCDRYLDEIEELQKEIEVPERFKERVKVCISLLNIGKSFANKINTSLNEMEENLDKAIENNDYKKILKYIKESENIELAINDPNFTINQNQKSRADFISEKARTYVENNYEEYIPRQNCKSITQLSSYENWMKYLIATLKELGYRDLSEKTNKKLIAVTDNLELLKEQQAARESSETFIKRVVINEFTSQEELLSIKKEGNRLIEVLNSNERLDRYIKAELINNINKIIIEADKYLTIIVNKITEIIDDTYEIADLKDCKQVLSKIEYILTKKLRQEDKADIEGIKDLLEDFIKEVEKIILINNLKERILKLQVLASNEEYEEISGGNVIENIINNANNEMILLEEQWINKNLKIDDLQVNSYDVNQCFSWKEVTRIIPYYISERTKDRYNNINTKIEERIAELKIDSILRIFNELNDSEKRRCIDILYSLRSNNSTREGNVLVNK